MTSKLKENFQTKIESLDDIENILKSDRIQSENYEINIEADITEDFLCNVSLYYKKGSKKQRVFNFKILKENIEDKRDLTIKVINFIDKFMEINRSNKKLENYLKNRLKDEKNLHIERFDHNSNLPSYTWDEDILFIYRTEVSYKNGTITIIPKINRYPKTIDEYTDLQEGFILFHDNMAIEFESKEDVLTEVRSIIMWK